MVNYRLSRHAQEEMQRRQIPLAIVESILAHPQQVIPQDKDKKVYQPQVELGDGKIFLVRVIAPDTTARPLW
jgi:hypothetical protein